MLVIGEENTHPDIEEQYATAVVSSNLRMVDHRRAPIDLILAAGMNPERLGMALRRLETEWHGASHPAAPTAKQIEAIAAAFKIEDKGTAYAGMVQVQARSSAGSAVDVEYVLPLVLARRTAAQWHLHELGLLLQRLKTLPEVRAALLHWTQDRGIEDGIHLVAAVLMWWLNPKCRECVGVKLRVVAGTGRTSGKLCKACKGSGESKVPHSADGRMLLAYIRECLGSSRKALAGKFKHHKRG